MKSALLRARKLWIAGALVAAFALTGACSDQPDEYVVYSGGETGVYYPTAKVIAELTNEASSDVELSVQTSGGSIENARALGDGDADLALIQNDIAAYARAGELVFEQPIPDILGLAALYPEHVQIVALADAGITSVTDLAGKAVAVGDLGSGTEQNANQILEAAGLTSDDLARVENLGAGDAVEALAAGDVDAAFFTFGLGTPAIEDLADQLPISFVPVDGDVRQRLLDQYEFYGEGVISAGSYSGVEQDVPTVVVTATLVARPDLPDDVVQQTLAAIFDHLDSFSEGRLQGLDLESAHDKLSMPLHPGAESFYAERMGQN